VERQRPFPCRQGIRAYESFVGSESALLAPVPRRRAPPSNIRLGDLSTFFAVRRYGGVTSAARALGVSPPQVSKAIARLEAQLQVVLLSRGSHGVALTDEALRILPDLEQVMRHLERVLNGASNGARQLTCAGASFLVSLFLPVIAQALPRVRLCALELPPAVLPSLAPENQFEIGLIAGRKCFPRSWDAREVGQIRRGLLARPELAERLGPPPVDPLRLKPWPFITPVYSLNGQFVQADDDCPLGFAERRLGHKTQTLRVALDLAASVDQVLFGPILAARSHIETGRLVEVPVRGWHVIDTLTLACNPERLLAQEFEAIVVAVERGAQSSHTP